mmetsp:Transcript_8766/g.17654  ORF Transcript_8766/g.17654 Transcript_8766/m.17654 type:complete len:167 (+) Transcript_8766:15-515(+)
MFAPAASLPSDWNLKSSHFLWPPGAHHARAAGASLPAMQGAAVIGVVSASGSQAHGSFDDSEEPFGGVDAAVAARVLALAASSAPPESAADYVQAHRLQPSLDAALNELVQSDLPAAPWEALIRCLPADLMVPPPPTLPSPGMDAAALGLDRLKAEFLWLHGFGNE